MPTYVSYLHDNTFLDHNLFHKNTHFYKHHLNGSTNNVYIVVRLSFRNISKESDSRNFAMYRCAGSVSLFCPMNEVC